MAAAYKGGVPGNYAEKNGGSPTFKKSIRGIRGGTTTSRERIINIFISGFLYVFTFIYKDGSTSICSVLADCSAWSRKCSLR